MTHVTTAYISASTNRYSRAAHASDSSLVAFGSFKLVGLWDAADGTDSGVFETLPGHKGLVTCIRFLDENCFLSADDKGWVRCWRKLDSKWKATFTLQAHAKAVSALAALGDCVVTGSSDASFTVWKFVRHSDQNNSALLFPDELQVVQNLDMKGRYALDIQLTVLPGTSSLILAIGVTDRDVHIWTRTEENFILAASLSGHEDWIKSLAFQNYVSGPRILTLASGSQDGTIRLWNIERYTKNTLRMSYQTADLLADDLLDTFEAALGDVTEGEEGGRQISMKRHIVTIKTGSVSSQQFSITFDALLVGHEAGITSLCWRPRRENTDQLPTLLSTSTDSSVILWSPSSVSASSKVESSSIWINRQRFGDISGQKLGGFVGGLWAHHGDNALAWGWNGSWRRWGCLHKKSLTSAEVWDEIGAISGHNGPVRGLSWSPHGEYMLSTSLDQTTRIHANINGTAACETEVWHELGRPQIHGYDLINAVFFDPIRFVSIADEKVARVFVAPQTFLSISKRIGILTWTGNETNQPLGALVPPLGLSNKATSQEASEEILDTQTTLDHDTSLHRRPFEGELSSSTLWPEIEKVFGHGYEVISLSASCSGRYIATSCKATAPEHAVVRVYETQTWKLFGHPLQGHSLSVTRIAFSPDDQFILTVSRDRSWRLFVAEQAGYVPIAADNSHTRIIWDCAWACEGDIFATAARDKTVKFWKPKDLSSRNWTAVATIRTIEAATAVAFSQGDSNARRLVAIGTENGDISIYSGATNALSQWRQEITLDRSIAHVDHIYQLAWRPRSTANHQCQHQLASCSEDGTLKLLDVHFSPT